ncbi:hypothetical protein VTO58DRAFT_109390 [Aureobasidium pullulans]
MIYLGRGVDYNLSSPTYTRSIGQSSSLVVVILAFQIRVPLSVAKIVKTSESDRPSAGYIYRRKAADTCASDILLCSEDGEVSTRAELHRLVWTPALPSESPYRFGHVIFLTNKGNELVMSYQSQLEAKGYSTCITDDPDQIRCIQQETIVIQVPRQ